MVSGWIYGVEDTEVADVPHEAEVAEAGVDVEELKEERCALDNYRVMVRPEVGRFFFPGVS